MVFRNSTSSFVTGRMFTRAPVVGVEPLPASRTLAQTRPRRRGPRDPGRSREADLLRDRLKTFDGDREELVQRKADPLLDAGDLVSVHAGSERLLFQLLLHGRD